MSQPLYFLPHLQWNRDQSLSTTRLILRERGLAAVFSDVPQEQICIAQLNGRGPGDLSGTIICYQTPAGEIPRRIGYYANEQRWQPVGDGSLCWIGIDTDDPPGPESLRRRKEHAGYRLELGDGNSYMIPIIRRPNGSTGLPTDLYLDAAGKLCEPIKPAYERYWEASAEVCSWFFSDNPPDTIDTAKALRLAVDAVSLNYRFTMQEQNALRLIDKENFMTVLLLSIDWPAVRDDANVQKKT